MPTNMQKAIDARAGGRVERAHGIPHQSSYSNAMHQWGVAMLMHAIWPEDFPRLALHCLSHDVPEAWVGDIPSPTIRYVPGLKDSLAGYERTINLSLGLPAEQDLPEKDYQKLKACDRLELYIWCMEQQMLGNKYVDGVIAELDQFFSVVGLPAEAAAFLEDLKQNFKSPPTQTGVMRRLTSE